MKLKSYTKLAIILLITGPALGQERKKPIYRDAETHDLLVRKFKVNQNKDPMKKFVPSEGEDPTLKNQPTDLISSSDIISFNGVTTLVPKRAIIQIPDKYSDRINNHKPGNKVVGWLEFHTLNRGWITTVEVSRAQAEGKEPLAEAVAENIGKSRNLVVATYSTGPISMLPQKVKEENNNTETASK
ncbi:MAG: hypothetical protein AB8D78_15435 [Akkermansiaceae bacterium]